MKKSTPVVVAGLGETGKPLFQIVTHYYDAIGIDITPCDRIERAEVLHVCYPFQIDDFIGETARYIDLFKPDLTVSNSTVAIGTTRAITERTRFAVVDSAIRGKHARMSLEAHSMRSPAGKPPTVSKIHEGDWNRTRRNLWFDQNGFCPRV